MAGDYLGFDSDRLLSAANDTKQIAFALTTKRLTDACAAARRSCPERRGTLHALSRLEDAWTYEVAAHSDLALEIADSVQRFVKAMIALDSGFQSQFDGMYR
jgi:hypothetical protein